MSDLYYQCKRVQLIGISGKLGSGKTTLCHYIREKAPQFEKKSFAENLRRIVSTLVNVDVEATRSITDKNVRLEKWGFSIGELLQLVGTEVVRSIHPDAWILSLFEYHDEETSYWILDDVRFRNEADAIRSYGGVLIRLNGDPGECVHILSQSRNTSHASEVALDDYEHFDVIINTDDYRGNTEGLFDSLFVIK